MIGVSPSLAFIGPGGPEFLVVMLVLLMMFGAKDAPRILRKLNEIISQIRNTADGFRREVMYGDLNGDASSTPSDDDESHYDEDYDYDEEHGNEVFHEMEENLTREQASGEADSVETESGEGEPEVTEPEAEEDGDGDVQKT